MQFYIAKPIYMKLMCKMSRNGISEIKKKSSYVNASDLLGHYKVCRVYNLYYQASCTTDFTIDVVFCVID